MKQQLIVITYALSMLFCLSCKNVQKGTVSSAAFYNMSVKYLRADASAKDLFQVYAKGNSEKDCKNNAQVKVLQELIFNGINSGKIIVPILNEPAMITSFKQQEESFYQKQINNTDVVSVQTFIADDKMLKQTEDKTTTFSMQVVVAVNRKMLSQQVLKSIIKN